MALQELPIDKSDLLKLRIREFRIAKKEVLGTDKDTNKFLTSNLKEEVAESRSCPNTDCLFVNNVLDGGYPCNKCKYLVKGDFYIKDV